jgi:hypothetical protein
MPRLALAVLISLLAALPALADGFTVTGGSHDLANVVCSLSIPAGGKIDVNALKHPDGTIIPAATFRQTLTGGPGSQIVFVLPRLKSGETITLVPTDPPANTPRFAVSRNGELIAYMTDDRGETSRVLDLYRPGKFEPADKKAGRTAEIANPSSKPFHHLWDATGQVRLTNGPEGRYPHHRGLYFGFNRVSYDGKTADVWHCTGGAHQFCTGLDQYEAGRAAGRQRIGVSWIGQDGKPFAAEKREYTVYRIGDGTLVEFASVLTTDLPKVRLDGDPQHAGFHFRANAEVEKSAKETYFLRPTGKGEPGKELNWDAKGKNRDSINRPWTAMSFVLGGKRYTAVYLDHPDNPKEARYSERTYGRTGTYFEYDLTPEKPLKVKYRVWVQEGEVTPEQCEMLSRAFVSPPVVTVGK